MTLFSFICPSHIFSGHQFNTTGYLNADRHALFDPMIGEYEACSCGAWRFTAIAHMGETKHCTRKNFEEIFKEAIRRFALKGVSTPDLRRRVSNKV